MTQYCFAINHDIIADFAEHLSANNYEVSDDCNSVAADNNRSC